MLLKTDLLRVLAAGMLSCLALVLFATPASAEVVSSTDDAFTLRWQTTLDRPSEAIWASLGAIGDWWEDSHTYGGDASAMTLERAPGGCFCEALPGGGVRHGEVLIAWPERMLRLEAPLGPLQAMGATAILTFEWAAVTGDEAGSWRLTTTYVVSGPGVGALAPVVDRVLTTQQANLIDHMAAD